MSTLLPSPAADAASSSRPGPADPGAWPPPGEARLLLAAARGLRQAVSEGPGRSPLRGKNIGLLSETPDSDDARRFQSAAAELGAQVARLLPSLAALRSDSEAEDTARVLGRLYDALECQGLDPALVQQLQRTAGVPVFQGLATAAHPDQSLAEAWAAAEPPMDVEACRRYLLQASLVRAIA